MTSGGSSPALDKWTSGVIAVAASNHWDGNDGPWSTFDIHVGTPPQAVRVLVSTSVGESWIVSGNKTQGGCLMGDPLACPELRGGLFDVNASSTWKDKGIYVLGTELNLPDYTGDYVNGDYGFDALGLGPINDPSIRFRSQTISAIATKSFFLGSLGISSQRTNFSTFTDSNIPLLTSLKESNTTNSLSYGYTAGAKYRQNTTGSLTLGGYDASKFEHSDATFTLFPDISRDIVVRVKKIEFRNQYSSKSLLSEGVLIFIDSRVSEIWLPRDCCRRFEEAFGLEYNSTLNRYLINDTLHDSLRASNSSVSIVLDDGLSSPSSSVNITLPYDSFDLELGYPYVNSTQYYFPLRRADNDTQYTLGRTFLQEAYLVVDYERGNFSVHPNSWNFDATPQLVSIPAVNSSHSGENFPAANSSQSGNNITAVTSRINHTKVPIIAGTTIGVIIATIATIAILVLRGKRKKRRQKRKQDLPQEKKTPDESYHKPELNGVGKFQGELDGANLYREADGQPVTELPGNDFDFPQPDQYPREVEGSAWAGELMGALGCVETESREVAELEGAL